jgi:5-(carboxyamino)imidazole ribonucleotide mutase
MEVVAMKKVAVLMGSDSDLRVVESVFQTLERFGVPHEAHVYSAHRTPEEARDFALQARLSGFGVIIAAAGMAAHLAGAIAANTTLPVIGIPINAGLLGIDALLSTVQMPPGIPVATVGVDNATNAALLAVEILAVADDALAARLDDMRAEMREKILKKDRAVAARFNARTDEGGEGMRT